MVASVESKNPLRGWIVKNRVGVLPHILDLADQLESFQIENADSPFATIAGKSAVQVRSQSNAVNARSVWDVPNLLAGLRVDNDHMRAARNKDAMRIGIVVQIVPS